MPGIAGVARFARSTALLGALVLSLLLAAGCSGQSGVKSAGSTTASEPVGANMAGPVQRVVISKQTVANKPAPWVLSDPKAAVRSYLDWVSYAYRITESSAATRTMSAQQEVRVDSYVQLNLQKSRLLDQTLMTITFGKESVGATHTLLPATEHWVYRYVSIDDVGKTLEGPYTADYETTYTLVKSNGGWVVDSVAVKALGEVK